MRNQIILKQGQDEKENDEPSLDASHITPCFLEELHSITMSFPLTACPTCEPQRKQINTLNYNSFINILAKLVEKYI